MVNVSEIHVGFVVKSSILYFHGNNGRWRFSRKEKVILILYKLLTIYGKYFIIVL